jgi:hypothetical protein
MFTCPCIASTSLKYNQQDATLSRSIYFYKLISMFQAVPPPIIRSTKLYIQRHVLSNQYCCLLLSWMKWDWNCSTCFRRFLRPSSGAENCTNSFSYCQTNTAASCHRGWDGTETALHVSGGSSAHHQEQKTVHTPSDIVKQILLLAAIVDEMELLSISSAIAAGSSIGLTISDGVCTVMCSWWWAEEPPETCRVVYRNKLIEKALHLVGCTLEIYLHKVVIPKPFYHFRTIYRRYSCLILVNRNIFIRYI